MPLRLATEAEKIARDHLTFPEWGTALTLPQYLEREAVLRAHAFSRGMKTWFLVEGSEVLASCETYEMASRLGAARGTSYGIASVYTEQHLRGRGYATKLMDALNVELQGHAVVLYSDVGERIYARSGYVTAAAVDWVFTPQAGPALPAEVEAPVLGEPPPGVLQLEPTREQLDWAHARERLYARLLGRTPLSSHAARAGDARACWAAYFKSNELIVLWLTPGSPDETRAVLDAARAEAHRAGLARVRLWAPDAVAPPASASVQKRKEELPMVRSLSGHTLVTWRHVQRALWV